MRGWGGEEVKKQGTLHASLEIMKGVEECTYETARDFLRHQNARVVVFWVPQSFTTTALSLIKDYQSTWFCFLTEVLYAVVERSDPRLKRSTLLLYTEVRYRSGIHITLRNFGSENPLCHWGQ